MGDAAFERRTRTGRTPGIFVVEYLDAKLDLLLNEVLPKLGRESHTVRIPAGAPLVGILPPVIEASTETNADDLYGFNGMAQPILEFTADRQR